MRLLIDANISYRLAGKLRTIGHDVKAVLEVNPNASDEQIIRQARRERRTIITYDKDFGELVFKKSHRHYGILLLRTRDESLASQQKTLEHFLNSHQTAEIQKHFWVLTEFDFRREKSK